MSDIDVGKELVQALMARISGLEQWIEIQKREKAELEEQIEMWRTWQEEDSQKVQELNAKLVRIIDRFFEVLGLDRSEW